MRAVDALLRTVRFAYSALMHPQAVRCTVCISRAPSTSPAQQSLALRFPAGLGRSSQAHAGTITGIMALLRRDTLTSIRVFPFVALSFDLDWLMLDECKIKDCLSANAAHRSTPRGLRWPGPTCIFRSCRLFRGPVGQQ